MAIGNTFVHLNPQIFPNPEAFDPERWLKEDPSTPDHYLVAFSEGQRSCTGIKCVLFAHLRSYRANATCSLAWCELYLIFASIFRRLDLKLVNSRYAL